ncbi:hypothetical protein CPC08DRAFT_803050 [Agrocybe pediades]|nr:hypothetical protein CPC08DRAFT_803050 [Agrocybe pediades]
MKCTDRRFLYRAEEQMKLRELNFDVEALKRRAAAVSGSKECNHIEFIGEGAFNRVFELVMENGAKRVNARTPFPHAGPQTLLTNSEVATMEFVRERFNAPVPKVLAYDSSPHNEIGMEHIMEKCPGMAAIPFSQYGSIYFKEDVDPALQARPLYADGYPEDKFSERFRIGPLVDYRLYDDGRADLAVDQGPFKDAYSYLKAYALCEIAWIKKYAKSCKDPIEYRAAGYTSPKLHISLLEKWISIIPALLPSPSALAPIAVADEGEGNELLDLNKPSLILNDLHLNNFFVDEKGVLTGLIDLQSINIVPLFRAHCPSFMNDGRVKDRVNDILEINPPKVQDHAGDPLKLILSLRDGSLIGDRQLEFFLQYIYHTHPALYVALKLEYLDKLNPLDVWVTWRRGLPTLYRIIKDALHAYNFRKIPSNPKYPKLPIVLVPKDLRPVQEHDKETSIIALLHHIVKQKFDERGLDSSAWIHGFTLLEENQPLEGTEEVLSEVLEETEKDLRQSLNSESQVLTKALRSFRNGHTLPGYLQGFYSCRKSS